MACPAEATMVVVLAAGLIAQASASIVVAMLGLAEMLSLATQLLAVGLMGTAVAAFVPLPGDKTEVGSAPPNQLASDPLSIAATVLASITMGVDILSHARYTTSGVDSLWYHLPMVAEWIRNGSIWPTEAISVIYKGFPGFRETILVFLSLPFHQEHLALLGLVEFPLFVLAVYALGRELTGSVPVSLAAAVYAVTVPVVARANTTQKNDLSLAITFALAVLFTLRWFERPAVGRAGLAGLALGALAAIKFTGLAYAATILVVSIAQRAMVYRPRSPVVREPSRAPLCRAAVGAALFLLVAGPWYLRNFLAFGNPFYPAQVGIGERIIFDGPLTREIIQVYTLGWDIGLLIGHWRLLVDAYGFLILPIAASVIALGVATASRRQPLRKPLFVCSLSLISFLIFLHQPLNWGPKDSVLSDFNYNMRYLMPWFVCSLVAGGIYVTGLRRWAAPAAGLLIVGGVANLALWARWWWVLLAALLTTATYCWATSARPSRKPWRIPPPRFGSLILFMLIAASASALGALRAEFQYHRVYGYHTAMNNRGGIGETYAYVHRTLRNQRILLYGEEPSFPFYGDDLSNAVLPVHERLTPASLLARSETWAASHVITLDPTAGWATPNRRALEPPMGPTLLAAYPDRFSIAFHRGGTYVLKMLPPRQ
jgi:4-amino-4-deoxy-L-arabinose transferase-like glycosyltransferase